MTYIETGMPNFFCAQKEQLEGSARDALEILGKDNGQRYMLVRDEVVFAKYYGLCYGISEKPLVVGGIHPGHSMIPREEFDQKLEKEFLAAVCVSTCVKAMDRRSDLFQIQQMPRQRITNAPLEFEEVGEIAARCALAAVVSEFEEH